MFWYRWKVRVKKALVKYPKAVLLKWYVEESVLILLRITEWSIKQSVQEMIFQSNRYSLEKHFRLSTRHSWNKTSNMSPVKSRPYILSLPWVNTGRQKFRSTSQRVSGEWLSFPLVERQWRLSVDMWSRNGAMYLMRPWLWQPDEELASTTISWVIHRLVQGNRLHM